MTGQEDIDIATRLVVETGQASFSMLQRRMKIVYRYAEALIRDLYANGVVGPADAEGRREVIKEDEP